MYGLTEAGGVLAAGSGRGTGWQTGVCRQAAAFGRDRDPRTGRARDRRDRRAGRRARPTAISATPRRSRTPRAGCYRGSRAVRRSGLLYIVGRSKDTIIRGGENIASVHVESVLRSHPDVFDVAVVPLPKADLGEEVGAVVVLRPERRRRATDLRAFRQATGLQIRSAVTLVVATRITADQRHGQDDQARDHRRVAEQRN